MPRHIIQGIRSNKRAFVMFLIGCCLGSAIFLFLYGQKVNALLLERDSIYYANNQKYKEILKLEEEIEKYSKHGAYRYNEDEKIKKISVEVISQDLIGTQMVKETVEKMMEPFVDKSMHWISSNPELVAIVVNDKEITIKDQKVKIQVKYLSFYHVTLRIWVVVAPISSANIPENKK